ncbi:MULTISPECIES: DUF3597 domain-containing protein [unclassified Roseateles]|uniref:DUF3597 domain-containing protein n=1 Tax=unclassified Roseateles TaxID=2626991 RepID=UPI0009EA78C8|nr:MULTISPECIES: DUF3597 domain-containing protein [unclassified Roseateles]
MSFFSKILDKLGINQRDDVAPAPSTTSTAASSPPSMPTTPTTATAPGLMPDGSPAPIAIVDVEAQLEQRAAAHGQKLNWRTSIVDLLKLLDIDSSLDARKELAVELRCPPELMQDSAKMNVWLHKMVLAKIAVNGGKIPQSLLD